jgi:hypothetical protein
MSSLLSLARPLAGLINQSADLRRTWKSLGTLPPSSFIATRYFCDSGATGMFPMLEGLARSSWMLLSYLMFLLVLLVCCEVKAASRQRRKMTLNGLVYWRAYLCIHEKWLQLYLPTKPLFGIWWEKTTGRVHSDFFKSKFPKVSNHFKTRISRECSPFDINKNPTCKLPIFQ